MTSSSTTEKTLLDSTVRDRGYAVGEVVAEPRWLLGHLHDPGLRLIEVDVGPVAYDEGHIEGAVLWNVYQDLKDPGYQLVDKEKTASLAARSGIGADTTVVLYGYAPAMGFWLLKLYDHADVRILDCSREAWQEAGLPWGATAVTPPPTRYQLPDQDTRIRAALSTVQDAIQDPGRTIVDVRTESEFRGERFWPSGGQEPGGRAGHVPSAVSLPIEGLRREHGAFRDAADLRRALAPVSLSDSGEVITYCTIGARASTAWFVLTYLLGRRRVRVYDGSWAQWGLAPGTPVESGGGGISLQPTQ